MLHARGVVQNSAGISTDLFEFDTALLRWRQLIQNGPREPWPTAPSSYTTRLLAIDNFLYTVQRKSEGHTVANYPTVEIYPEGSILEEFKQWKRHWQIHGCALFVL